MPTWTRTQPTCMCGGVSAVGTLVHARVCRRVHGWGPGPRVRAAVHPGVTSTCRQRYKPRGGSRTHRHIDTRTHTQTHTPIQRRVRVGRGARGTDLARLGTQLDPSQRSTGTSHPLATSRGVGDSELPVTLHNEAAPLSPESDSGDSPSTPGVGGGLQATGRLIRDPHGDLGIRTSSITGPLWERVFSGGSGTNMRHHGFVPHPLGGPQTPRDKRIRSAAPKLRFWKSRGVSFGHCFVFILKRQQLRAPLVSISDAAFSGAENVLFCTWLHEKRWEDIFSGREQRRVSKQPFLRPRTEVQLLSFRK